MTVRDAEPQQAIRLHLSPYSSGSLLVADDVGNVIRRATGEQARV